MIVAGLILAGGRSTRFGAEKAMASLAGVPMVEYIAERLFSRCRLLAVSARDPSGAARWAAERGFAVVEDRPGNAEGPLAGVQAGLEWAAEAGAEILVTAPCDTPGLPKNLVTRLIDAAQGVGAVAANGEGHIEPLCGAWPISLRGFLDSALRHGGHPPVHELVAELGFNVVRISQPGCFANINRREDLATWAGHLTQ